MGEFDRCLIIIFISIGYLVLILLNLNAWHMRCKVTVVVLCVCVYLSVTALTATYLICLSKMRRHRIPCRLLKIFVVWTLLQMFFFRRYGLICLPRLSASWLSLERNIPMVLDMTRNSIIYGPPARLEATTT